MSQTIARRLLTPTTIALVAFIVLQGMDLLTTLLVFAHGGIELNPVVRRLLPGAPAALGVITSKGILSALAFPLSRRKRIMVFGIVLYTAVVAWNVWVLHAYTT